jgi:glycosyltransferase involved in cell wall biosynthesis
MTVVTIAFNDVEGVRRTVESTRSQSHMNIEHIVVDGGSQDGTREYLEGLDSRTRWVSEKDKGRYDAMNKGVAMATGDLVWFMNSADTFHSAESAAFVAARYAQLPFRWGYGLSCIVDEGRIVATGGRVPFDRTRFLLGDGPIPHQAAVFERVFFDRLGGYDVSFGLASDQLLMMKASMKHPPAVWAEFLCDFDATGAGSTRGAWAHYRDIARARRRAGIILGGSPTVDRLLTLVMAVSTLGGRIQRRLSTRINVRTSAS